MHTIKVSELTGPALDWAVATCELLIPNNSWVVGNTVMVHDDEGMPTHYTPSTNWAQGGPIIEWEKIDVTYCNLAAGWAATSYRNAKFGPTPLIAAMRCYVTSKLGNEVEIPEELLK